MITLEGMQLWELLALRRRVEAAIEAASACASPSGPLTEEEKSTSILLAIKSVRTRLGLSLAEAKDYVELHRGERYVP